MSNRPPIANTAAAAAYSAEKSASAAQPVKQGRWGWPRRPVVEVSKSSSGPAAAGPESSATIPSSPPVVSGAESLPPDEADRKLSSLPPAAAPKSAGISTAKLAGISDTEAELTSGDSKTSRGSLSTKRPRQPSLPVSQSSGLDPGIAPETPNPLKTRPSPPVIDLKTSTRPWLPHSPVRTQINNIELANQEDPLSPLSRKGSRSTTSTRRSSGNLTPARTQLSGSPFPSDAGDVKLSDGLKFLKLRRISGLEDALPLQETRKRTVPNQASLVSSPVSNERADNGLAGEFNTPDSKIARVAESVQPPQERAEQELPTEGFPSFPSRPSSPTARAFETNEAEGLEDAQTISPSLFPESPVSRPVGSGRQFAEENTLIPTGDASDTQTENTQIVPRATEESPWKQVSIPNAEDAGAITVEQRLTNDPTLGASLIEKEIQPGLLKRKTPSVLSVESVLHEKVCEPSAVGKHEDHEDLFARLPRDDSSSGTITPFEKVHEDPERSVAGELGLLELDATSEEPNGIVEPPPLAITKVRNEETPLLRTSNPLSPESKINAELNSAGTTTIPRNTEGLPRLPVANSAGASKNPSVAVGPHAKGEAPSNPEKTPLKSVPDPQDTDPTREFPLSQSAKTASEDENSFITVDSQPDRDYPSGNLLDQTVGVQVPPATDQEIEDQKIPTDIPELETMRTVIEIPTAHAKGKRLPIPRIYVQNPSDATENDVPSSVRKVSVFRENSIKGPRPLPSATGTATIRKSSSSRRPSGPTNPEAAKDAATNDGELRTPPLKKRKLYLRKARNVAARTVILKITLGRELAKQTKPALRRLAKGEYVVFEDSASSSLRV